MKRGWQWPVGIAAVLATVVIADVTVAIIAGRDEAFAVEPNYYQKAVHFDDEMALRAESQRLDWSLAPTLQLGRPGAPGTVSLSLHDSSGRPITGARVQLLAMHNARASHQLTASLTERGDGKYDAPLDAERPGEWELRFLVTRGGDRFASRERIDAAPPH